MYSRELKRIADAIDSTIINEGDGYRSVFGVYGSGFVAYVELPRGHPDIGKDDRELNPKVNGGLTFTSGRIFGWDYSHGWNGPMDFAGIDDDIRNALAYFRRRGKKKC